MNFSRRRITPPAAAQAPMPPAREEPSGPMDLVHLLVHCNLHPELNLHPSWLPTDWPAHHRSVAALGRTGQAVLANVLRQRMPVENTPDFNFDSRLKRLILLDTASLRRLAVYCGLCAHKPLLKVRGGVAAQMRRQAQRFDEDAVEFVMDRMPQLSEIKMNTQAIEQRPIATGSVIVNRGYRLLLGAVAPEGEVVLQRLRRKLPRRVSSLNLPRLQPRQIQQLSELMLLCIVPERLPQWDWLF